MFALLPRDILQHEIRPKLDDITLLCLRIAFGIGKYPRCPKKLDPELQQQVVSHGVELTKHFEKLYLLQVDRIQEYAVQSGRIDVLKYATAMVYGNRYVDLHGVAATYGRLDMLKYLCDREVPKSKHYAFIKAAFHGHLDCLRYLHQRFGWDREWTREYNSITHNAAIGGRLDCLKYAYENGCEWNFSEDIVQRGHTDIIEYAIIKNKLTLSTSYCVIAARHGRLECLKLLFHSGLPLSKDVVIEAARNNHMACIEFAYEHGCEWDTRVCNLAARNGNLKLLQYAHEHGCPWDDITCLAAAQYQNLPCLQYARKNDCPWNKNLCFKMSFGATRSWIRDN